MLEKLAKDEYKFLLRALVNYNSKKFNKIDTWTPLTQRNMSFAKKSSVTESMSEIKRII
jgi:hypothetical protein